MKALPLFLLTVILGVRAPAQTRNYNVIMGDRNWLNFYNEQASILRSTYEVTKRNATMSEPDGALSVIVDEVGIHNVNFDLVQGGSALELGWPVRLASLLILPKPEAPLHYFVFVNTAEDDKQAGYVEVDMSLNLGAGGVVGTGTTWYMTNTTAKLAATAHGNAADYWVLQHQDGSNEFHAFRLSISGVDPQPVISATGPQLGLTVGVDTYSSDFWSAMKFSVQGEQLAMGYDLLPDTSGAALFFFDPENGEVIVRADDLRFTSHYIDGLTGDTVEYNGRTCLTSGIDFLPTDDFLYVAYLDTTHGDGGLETVQYDLSWLDEQVAGSSTGSMGHSMSQTDPIGADTTGQSMLLAPDGQLYLRSPHGYGVGVFQKLVNAPHPFGAPPPVTFTSFFSPDLHDTWGLPLTCKRYHDSEPVWLGYNDGVNERPSFRVIPNPIGQQGSMVWGNSPPPDHLIWRDALGRAMRSEPAITNGPTTVLARRELPAGLYMVEVLRDGKTLGSATVIIE